MAIDNKARALATQSCSTISVNGNTFVSEDGLITLPNYPNSGEGAFYTAGDNILIDGNNIISGDYKKVTTLADGLMSKEDKIKLDTVEEHANNYSLPTASDLIKGGIKVNGTNMNVSEEILTISNATQSVDGLESSEDKTKLDGIEENANNYVLPTSSTTVKGGVKVDGTTITISNEIISSPTEINDALSSLTSTYSSDKILEILLGYQTKRIETKLYGTKSGTYTVDLTNTAPTVSPTNYIETLNTTNTVFDWVNGLNITLSRTSANPIKLKKTDFTAFNLLVAFNRLCSVEYGAICYADGVPISTQQTFGNQDFNGVAGFTIAQTLKYNLYFDLLGDEVTEYPAGTVFTTKLFKRQEASAPTLTTHYLFGVNVNNIDRISYATIETNV